jgi:DNA-binding MarR family transcriptional regulator
MSIGKMPSGKKYRLVAKEGMLRKNDQGQAAAAFYEKRRMWLDYLSTNSAISHVEFRVAYFISKRMNGDDQSSWWHVKTIAKEVGCSTNSVSKATMKLEDMGLLIAIRPARGGNKYFIRMPYEHTQ